MRTQKLIYIDQRGNEIILLYINDLEQIKLFYNGNLYDIIDNATLDLAFEKFKNIIDVKRHENNAQ